MTTNDPTQDLPASASILRKPEARHWTKHGTLEIRARQWLGGFVAAIYLDGRFIQHYSYPRRAAEAVGLGEVNAELGFDAVAAAVPPNIDDWRDPLSALDGIE